MRVNTILTWIFVILFTIFMFMIPAKPAGATEISTRCLDQQGNVQYVMVWETPRPWFVNGREVPFGQTTVTYKEPVGSNPQVISIPAYNGRIDKSKTVTVDWSRCVPRPTTTTTTTAPETTTTVPETTTTLPGTTTTAPRPTTTPVPETTTSMPTTTVAPRVTTTTFWMVTGAPTTTPPTLPADDTPDGSARVRATLPNTGFELWIMALGGFLVILAGATLVWVVHHRRR